MKLQDITEEGFYWNRLDEHRDWSVVFVERCSKSPKHPMYNDYRIGYKLNTPSSWCSNIGEFRGPIIIPD